MIIRIIKTVVGMTAFWSFFGVMVLPMSFGLCVLMIVGCTIMELSMKDSFFYGDLLHHLCRTKEVKI